MSEERKFKRLHNIKPVEVSMCYKHNPAANNHTEFDIVKTESIPVCWEEQSFTEQVFSNMEMKVSNSLWNLFIDTLQDKLWSIQHSDTDKDVKFGMVLDLFDEFLNNLEANPLIKTKDLRKKISPTNDTIEKKVVNMSKMEIFKKAIKDIENLFPFSKEEEVEKSKELEEIVETEKASEEVIEVEAIEKTEIDEVEVEKLSEEVAEELAETLEVKKTIETVEEETVKKTEETETVEVEKTEEISEIEKTMSNEIAEINKAKESLETEIAELKKAREEQDVAIEKASFVSKAREEFPMLSGSVEEQGENLYALSKSLSPELYGYVCEQFKKSSVEIEKASEEVGKTSDETISEAELINKQAIEKAKKDGTTIEVATYNLLK